MTRRRLAALAALAAVVHVPAALAGAVSVSSSVSPQPSRLGDVIHVTLTVRADAAATVVEGFSPFQVVGSTSSHREHGGVTETIWRFDLQCLQAQCAPGPGPRTVKLTPATVRVGSSSSAVHVQPVTVVPRVTAHQVSHPASSFQHPLTPPPASYRFSPATVRRVLWAAAVALVVLALVLLVPAVRPRRARSAAPAVDPLAKALALVLAARTRPPPDRRRALGLLSRTVRARAGRDAVARDAADLAWSKPEPQPASMTHLAERVEDSE